MLGVEPGSQAWEGLYDTATLLHAPRLERDLNVRSNCFHLLTQCNISDSCGVRAHALADWRLKPAP